MVDDESEKEIAKMRSAVHGFADAFIKVEALLPHITNAANLAKLGPMFDQLRRDMARLIDDKLGQSAPLSTRPPLRLAKTNVINLRRMNDR